MSEAIYVDRKDLTSQEVLDHLNDGTRVLIEVDVLGKTLRMALRRQAGTYYCDTPIKLLTYDTEAEMRNCLERYRLARAEDVDETEEGVRSSASE